MSGRAYSLLLPLALLFYCHALGAQEPEKRWNLQLELGFNGASGNSSFLMLRTGAKATWLQTETAEFEASYLLRYARSDGEVVANDTRTSLKLDLWPRARWSPFVYTDASRDRQRRLDLRLSGGGGVKYAFWAGESGSASLSAALLYDYQDFRLDPGEAASATESSARWSVRSRLEKTLGETAAVRHTVFYQPVWKRSADYVLTMVTAVSTKVLANLALSVEHEYLRDATPPPGVRADDQKISVLFTLSL